MSCGQDLPSRSSFVCDSVWLALTGQDDVNGYERDMSGSNGF